MSATACQRDFQRDRIDLLKQYRLGVESALLRARFLRSSDLMVLQAFVIYLTCGRRDKNGPDVCTLTGLAIGNAMKLGLHCDGASMNLPPFETEMRRRLWWQICTLDVRNAEDHGIEPNILEPMFSTEFPSNVYDISLDPDMRDAPVNQQTKTDMIFSLVRFQGSHFARRVVFSDKFCRANSYPVLTEAEKCLAIDEFKKRLEVQFLSHCDAGVPLDFVTTISIRLILDKLTLAVCKPKAEHNRTSPLKSNYQRLCYEVLQQAQALRQYEKGSCWLWLFQTYVEWDAMAYLLLDLCINPSVQTPDTAWSIIDSVYAHWKNDDDIYRDGRWVHIEELRAQAIAVRDKTQATTRVPEGGCINGIQDSSMMDTRRLEGSPKTTNNPISENGTSPMVNGEQGFPRVSEIPVIAPADSEHSSEVPASSADSSYFQPTGEMATNDSDLPGAGTACEWSAALIERYWEVAGIEQVSSTAWL
ncbi:hypothetical protein AK830_g89 [Neonectria ditissima]|uniref:Xylanolytic transcriptional activator regulatory domain-containing protein n=1 Tax=Neonectria ditissima TaxID=78410 RepID=A0A0P7BXT6_9HYPO|nr:hypothetical protein AK830_g89 [Neonectria ditissima]